MTSSSSEAAVIVPTFNRQMFLPELVAALKAQSAASFKVVMVDDGSSDDTVAVATAAFAGDPRFRILSTSNRGPAAARNTAIAQSTSEWLAFTDDDCLPQPGWLAALLQAARATGASVVQGQTVSDPTARVRDLPWFTRGKDVGSWSNRFQMCNLLLRRDAVEEAGGLDERFPPHGFGEDTDLGLRMVRSGAATAFAPDAVVHHRVLPMSYLEFLRRRFRWAQVVRVVALNPDGRETFRHPYVAHRSHLVFWLAVPVMVAAPVLGAWWLPVLGVAGYAAQRVWATRDEDRSLLVRLARSPLELVGLVVEALGFAVKSVRFRRWVV